MLFERSRLRCASCAPSWSVGLLLAMLASSGVTGLVGCSTFQDDRDAMAAYERTLRNEDGSSVRPVSYEEEVEDDDGIDIEDLSPAAIGRQVKSAAGYGPDRDVAEDLFARGEAAFRQASQEYQADNDSRSARASFIEAANLFYSGSKRWPESRLEQDGLFRAGESYFFADQYARANQSFELLIQKYPGTRYLDMAQSRRFAIAQYWLELNRESPDNLLSFHVQDKRRPTRDTKGNALRVLNRIRLDDPTGRLADDATMALANAYFEEQRYLDAADTYEDLRIAFPTSQHQYDAHLLELRARIEAYQGSAYDGTHLQKADKLLSSVMKQFPTEIDRDRDELMKIAAEVRFRLAQRDMKMARYYDYSGQYRSATIYYQEVIEKYAGTPQAEEAAERISIISDKPGKPAQRAQWLVDLFPEADEMKPLIPSSPTRAALK